MSAFTKPASNKACMLTGPNEVDVREFPLRDPGANDVVVKVESTGLCGSDLHNYVHGGVGKPIEEPLVLGHESAGTLSYVGEEAAEKGWKVGDRVAIEPTMYCSNCPNCEVGKTNVCREFKQASLAPTHGTLAEYYVAGSQYIVKVPESISWEEAGCIQPLAVAVQLAKRAKLTPGKTLAVFGCGPLGCMIMHVARALGISKILAFDISPSRVAFINEHKLASYAVVSHPTLQDENLTQWAARFKADVLKEAGVEEWGVDVAVEAAGVEPVMHAAVAFVHPGGTYVQAGLGRPINSFPTLQVVAKELDVIGTVRYTAGCFQTAIDFMAEGKIDLKPMITKTYPLRESKEALEAVKRGGDLKVVVMSQQ